MLNDIANEMYLITLKQCQSIVVALLLDSAGHALLINCSSVYRLHEEYCHICQNVGLSSFSKTLEVS